jgi:hypothetical protein
MTDLFKLLLGILASRFKARATLEAENLVLRQQVNVLRRRRSLAVWVAAEQRLSKCRLLRVDRG